MEDVTRAFFWWTNVQHLRVLLQQLQDGDVHVVGDWSWLRDEMDPQLLVRFLCISFVPMYLHLPGRVLYRFVAFCDRR